MADIKSLYHVLFRFLVGVFFASDTMTRCMFCHLSSNRKFKANVGVEKEKV